MCLRVTKPALNDGPQLYLLHLPLFSLSDKLPVVRAALPVRSLRFLIAGAFLVVLLALSELTYRSIEVRSGACPACSSLDTPRDGSWQDVASASDSGLGFCSESPFGCWLCQLPLPQIEYVGPGLFGRFTIVDRPFGEAESVMRALKHFYGVGDIGFRQACPQIGDHVGGN